MGAAACGPGVDRVDDLQEEPVAANCTSLDPNHPAVVTVRDDVATILQRVRVANGLGNNADLEEMRARVKEALQASINTDLVSDPIVTFADLAEPESRELTIDPELKGTVDDLVSEQLQDSPGTAAGSIRFTPLTRATITDQTGKVWFDQEIGVAAQFGQDGGKVIDNSFSHRHAATAFVMGQQQVIHQFKAPVFVDRQSMTLTTEDATGALSVFVSTNGGEQTPYMMHDPANEFSESRCSAWDGTDDGDLAKFCPADCEQVVGEMKAKFDTLFQL